MLLYQVELCHNFSGIQKHFNMGKNKANIHKHSRFIIPLKSISESPLVSQIKTTQRSQTSQKVNPWESQQSHSMSSRQFTSSSVIHLILLDCCSSFIKSKCLWFPKVGSSVTGWSSQLPQRPPLFNRDLCWVHQQSSCESTSLCYKKQSILYSACLSFISLQK